MRRAPVDIVDRRPPGLPLGVEADGTLSKKAVPIAFVVGTIAVVFAFPLGVLGVVLNSMGLERVRSDREAARKLVTWSWIVFAVTDTLVVLAALLILLLA